MSVRPKHLATISLVVGAALASCLLFACDPKEAARKKMSDLHIDFSADSLTKAVTNGDKDVVQLLQQAGLDINQRDVKGNTGLSVAVVLDKVEMVKILLAHGVRVSDKVTIKVPGEESDAPREMTPLHLAIFFKEKDIFDVLMAAKPDLAAKESSDGETPLLMAINEGNLEMTKALLDAGASVLDTTAHGNSALHLAVNSLNQAGVDLILAKTKSIDVVNDDGLSPADMAEILELPYVLSALKKRGAQPRVTSELFDAKALEEGLFKDAELLATQHQLWGYISRQIPFDSMSDLVSNITNAGFSPLQLLQVSVGDPAIFVTTHTSYTTTGRFHDQALYWGKFDTNLGSVPVFIQYKVSAANARFDAGVAKVQDLLVDHTRKVVAQYFIDYPAQSAAAELPRENLALLRMAMAFHWAKTDQAGDSAFFYSFFEPALRTAICNLAEGTPTAFAKWSKALDQIANNTVEVAEFLRADNATQADANKYIFRNAVCGRDVDVASKKAFRKCACDGKHDVAKVSKKYMGRLIEVVRSMDPKRALAH